MSDLNERVRRIAEAVAGLGYWSLNLETREVIWSKECYVLFGRNPDTWVPSRENFIEDIVPSSRSMFAQNLDDSIANREPYVMEYEYYRGGNRNDPRWYRTERTFLTDDDGVEYMVGVAKDITEQKRVELELRENNARFQAFADAASDWFWETDKDLRFTYLSSRAEDHGGVPNTYFVGKTRREVVGEVIDTEKWEAHFQDLEAHRPFRDFRYLRKGHDGRIHYITTSGIPLFDERGKFKGYAGAASNLTDRLEADEKLNLAREQLANAINALNDLFVLWGPDDRLIVCNDQFRELNRDIIETTVPGARFEDHIRAGLKKGLFPAAIGREEEWFEGRLYAHKNPGKPFELERQDGRWLLIKEQVLEDGSTITISSDITDRKQFEEHLHDAKQKAELANRAKSEFLAHMSHELRTPLNAIIGFSQICESEIFGKQEIRKYVEYASDIRVASTHLLELISDVLDLSKLEQGEFRLHETAFSVEQALNATIKMIRGKATAKDVGVSLSVDPMVHFIRADERLFKQIIINLLSNAVKYAVVGGQVAVQALLSKDQQLHVTIRDDGSGINEEDLKVILEPYAQLRPNSDVAHEGTGLGLPIVKRLLDLHGGVLWFESQPGEGTTVTAQLPAERTISNPE